MAKVKRGELLNVLIVTVPILLVLFFLFYYCVGWNIFMSFTDWKGFVPSHNTVGFSNYATLFSDPIFWISLKNNLVLILLFVPGVMLLGLGIAILLDQGARGEGFFRTIYLLPFAMSFVVTATLWTWMYSPREGTINIVLGLMRLNALQRGWITDPSLVMYCIVVALVWQFSGYSVVVFLGGMRSIPSSHVEAARIDGASRFVVYTRIIIPQLKGSFMTAFVIFMCFALKAFDFIWVLNKGGPGYSSHILGVSMYKETFVLDKYAYGASYSTIIFILSVVLILPVLYRLYGTKEKP